MGAGETMNPNDPLSITRRHFLSSASFGLGALGLAQILGEPAAAATPGHVAHGGLPGLPHFAPKVRRVIYLFQSGGPACQDLFDYKPLLREKNGEPLPNTVRGTQRLTGMSANQAVLPLAGSAFEVARHGQSSAWVSELLPHTARVVDELCFIRSMWTEASNHDPAITFFQTGSQIAGRASIGACGGYGRGT